MPRVLVIVAFAAAALAVSAAAKDPNKTSVVRDPCACEKSEADGGSRPHGLLMVAESLREAPCAQGG